MSNKLEVFFEFEYSDTYVLPNGDMAPLYELRVSQVFVNRIEVTDDVDLDVLEDCMNYTLPLEPVPPDPK